jgi:hypothetical protein
VGLAGERENIEGKFAPPKIISGPSLRGVRTESCKDPTRTHPGLVQFPPRPY